jgi:hypothetical protein
VAWVRLAFDARTLANFAARLRAPPWDRGEYWVRFAERRVGAGVGKDDRRLYICPECNGSQVVVKWKRADVGEEQEIATTELCPTCDGSGQILGPST